MKALLGRVVLISGMCLGLAACFEQSTVTIPDAPKNDETYKQQFSDDFNQACYNGFIQNFEQRPQPATERDYQAAKGICECISFNLVQNNDNTQLTALSKQTPEQMLDLTRPLVLSCSEQIQQKLAAEYASRPIASEAQP